MILQFIPDNNRPPGLVPVIHAEALKFVKRAASDGSPPMDVEVIENAMWHGIIAKWSWLDKLYADNAKAMKGVGK